MSLAMITVTVSAALLSTGIQTFIDENIRCVEELEVLLVLRKHPEKDWDAVDVSHELKIDPISASNYLMGLYLKGLLGHQEHKGRFYSYRYRTVPKAKDKQLSELAAAFERARSEVVDYIFTSQRRQFRAFSEVFDLKKKDK